MSSHHSASDELAAWDPLADDGGDFLAEPEAAAYSYDDDYGEEADDPVVDMPHREPPARPAPTVAPDAINIMEFSEADDYSSTEDPPSADAYVEPQVPAVPATERAARRPPRPSDSVMAGAGLGVAADVALVDRTESSTSSYDADGSSDYIPPPDHGGGAGNAVYDFHVSLLDRVSPCCLCVIVALSLYVCGTLVSYLSRLSLFHQAQHPPSLLFFVVLYPG